MQLSSFAYFNLQKEMKRLITRSSNNAIFDEHRNPTEPKLTRKLAMQIGNSLLESLSSYIPDYVFTVHSIFCHQFPYVHFGKNSEKCCELGDLLFIYSEDGKDKGNSLLLQAKKVKDTRLKKVDKKQFELYTKSPEFTYSLSNSEIRKIPNAESFNGAQYLLMFPPYDCDCQYRSVLPAIVKAQFLSNTDFLADKLVCLFSDEGIGEFNKSQDDDWSKIIKDFLKRKELNKKVLDNLEKRDFSCGRNYLYEIKDFNEETLKACSVEIFATQYGTAVYYLLPKSDSLLDNPNIENNNGEMVKPFLVVYINAKEKEKN